VKRVLDNMMFGLSDAEPRRAASAALPEVGLAGRECSWPSELSGGEQQRVALARSLARQPQLLLADEPFDALDALTRIRMRELLRRLCERHRPTVLLITHHVDEAIYLAQRVLCFIKPPSPSISPSICWSRLGNVPSGLRKQGRTCSVNWECVAVCAKPSRHRASVVPVAADALQRRITLRRWSALRGELPLSRRPARSVLRGWFPGAY
jgi:ABC transporter